MFSALFAAAPFQAIVIDDLWFDIPLVVAISLVYSATRHERAPAILGGALRFGGWICLFMGIAFAIIYYLSISL